MRLTTLFKKYRHAAGSAALFPLLLGWALVILDERPLSFTLSLALQVTGVVLTANALLDRQALAAKLGAIWATIWKRTKARPAAHVIYPEGITVGAQVSSLRLQERISPDPAKQVELIYEEIDDLRLELHKMEQRYVQELSSAQESSYEQIGKLSGRQENLDKSLLRLEQQNKTASWIGIGFFALGSIVSLFIP